MPPRKKPTASAEARSWWTTHPDGEHGDCVVHLMAKGYRRKGSEKLTKISHQARFLLSRAEDGKPSELTIARRNKTRSRNAAAEKRKAIRAANSGRQRHPRERDDTCHLMAYWRAHPEDGSHDDAVASVPAGIDTGIKRSYQARSKVRAEDHTGNGDDVAAETPTAAMSDTEIDATDKAANGSVAEHLSRAKAFIVEAEKLKTSDPFKAPAPMEKAMEAIAMSIAGMSVAMANA